MEKREPAAASYIPCGVGYAYGVYIGDAGLERAAVAVFVCGMREILYWYKYRGACIGFFFAILV